ncbi:MAG: hypothetical protein JWN25_2676 [Verrucomicrobiales bacterium]|nr:hypothetical protein [Verrucomicrobiales bacterium]
MSLTQEKPRIRKRRTRSRQSQPASVVNNRRIRGHENLIKSQTTRARRTQKAKHEIPVLPQFPRVYKSIERHAPNLPAPKCWKFGSRARLPRWDDTLVGLSRRGERSHGPKSQHFHLDPEIATFPGHTFAFSTEPLYPTFFLL